MINRKSRRIIGMRILNLVKSSYIAAAIIVSVSSPCVGADLQFHGFITASGGATSTSKLGVSDYNQDLSFESDSIFGIQTTAKIENNFTITAQFVSRGNENFNTQVDWAYLHYDLDDNTSVKVGRQRVPLYMYSQVLEVGYAYPWIRPPIEMYSILPFTAFNGADVVYKNLIASVESSVEIYIGSLQEEVDLFGTNNEVQLRNMIGLAWTLEKGWLMTRVGIHLADVTARFSEFDELYLQLEQAGFSDVANELRLEDKTGEFYELGLRIDLDKYLIVAEATELIPEKSIIPEHPSWYALFGYRTSEKQLLHLTVANVNARSNNSIGKQIPSGSGFDSLISAIESALHATDTKQQSIILGFRYDYLPGLAFKLEAQRIFTDASRGTLVNRSDANYDRPFTFFNFALDAVF